jgi:hypothetical protein
VSLVVIAFGVAAICGGAFLLGLRPSPAHVWLWGPLLLLTTGLVVTLVGAAGP